MKKIKILFLAANPAETERLRIDAEWKEIGRRFRGSKEGRKFDIQMAPAVEASELNELLVHHQPQIVHFSGHGTPSDGIILENKSGGKQSVPAAAFAEAFSMRSGIRCLVLNACFTDAQAKAISTSIDFVIGMSGSIGDAAAIAFAADFYLGLASAQPVLKAFKMGRVNIGLQGLKDERCPRLWVRKGVNAKAAVLTGAPRLSQSGISTNSGKAKNSTGISTPSASDLKEFEALCRKSFEYCLERKRHPKLDSNTCMYFYGLNFNPQSPKLRPVAVVQAIGTELDHLDRVIFRGEIHNPGKQPGVEQIADEIVDMFRYVFILAIVHGIEEWDALKCTETFCRPYKESNFASSLSESARLLQRLYQKLLTAFNRSSQYNEAFIRRWIKQQLMALGGVARCEKVSIRDLNKDLHQRLNEDKNSPYATTQHSRHSFPTQGQYLICQVHFPEVHGTYRVLLNQVADQGLNLWASTSKAMVYGETAEAWLLFAVTGKTRLSEQEFTERIDQIKNKVESSYSGDPSINNKRLFSIRPSAGKHFTAQNEGEFLKVLSTALSEFWSVARD
jgi:hypothetical protein